MAATAAKVLYTLYVAVVGATGTIERPEQFDLTQEQCTEAASLAVESAPYARCRPTTPPDLFEPDWVDPAKTAIVALPSGRVVRLYLDDNDNWPMPHGLTGEDREALAAMMEPIR